MGKKEICVVLDNIRSRENVGSVFRTADAAGVSKIYLCGITPVPPHEKISKTALGAEKYISWEYHKQTSRCLLELKNQKSKVKIIGLEQTESAVNIFKFKALGISPLALVLGNEVRGLSPRTLKYCDKKVFIPMHGKKESLNVAVAFGIAVYQIIR
jgi:23S rRNA (guanosine2251-2'-O)-methyltransferase